MQYFAGDLSTTHSAICDDLMGAKGRAECYDSHSVDPHPRTILRHGGWENMKVMRFRVFDTRTRRVVTGAGIYRKTENLNIYEGDLAMWHNSPVDIVVDVAYGPCDVIEFDPVPGKGYSAPDADLRLVDRVDASGSSFGGSQSQVNIGLPRKPDETREGLLFVCQPGVRASPFTIELLDADGAVISGGGGTSGMHALYFVPRDRSGDVERIRIIRRKTLRRVFFHLPYWPGLPPENANVDNLFDVHIPYVNLKEDLELERFFRSSLQLSEFRRTLGARRTAGFLPREYTDTSVRDILKEYVDALDAAYSLSSDCDTLEVHPSDFSYAFRQMLRRIFGVN